MMYNNEDIRCASKRVRSCAIRLGVALLLMLEGYVIAAVQRSQLLMLAILLAAFACAMIAGDLHLIPAVRYLRFLKEMSSGLRRNTACVAEMLENDVQMQDGVLVHALHVRLQDGDSRIFYVNREKTGMLPKMGAKILLESCGRHVTGWQAQP